MAQPSTIVFGTYSFFDILCTINGPGGSFPLGTGAGVEEGGITIEPSGDKDTMVVGADGGVIHNLHADMSGRVIVRLQLTSPTNAALGLLYATQTVDSSLHGLNTIILTDLARGDNISARGCGFARAPTLTYAREGQMREWTFNAAVIDRLLGTGVINVTPL